jgi:divalent metal cation (Fe/Co/Zn/Cd) transporter
MTLEAAIALAAAWKARSPALFGFGGDSIIELLSGIVVLWRFRSQARSETARAEKIAARIAGALLFFVALFVATTSSFALLGYYEPRPSIVGIVLLIVAAFGMPWLASQKRKLATQLSSASLRADAVESSLCGYLSWIALAGLVANALFGIWWADPVAALTLLPFVLKEGWQAIHASRPGCDCCSVQPTKGDVAANR